MGKAVSEAAVTSKCRVVLDGQTMALLMRAGATKHDGCFLVDRNNTRNEARSNSTALDAAKTILHHVFGGKRIKMTCVVY